MSKRTKVLASLFALALFGGLWIWWSQTEKVVMAEYVPADTLIYIEANSLPEIVRAFVTSKAWVDLSSASGVPTRKEGFDFLTALAGRTGIGSAESVILARAQLALCVVGFGAAETPGTGLRITPRGALVIETHTADWRVRPAAEKIFGSFARRTLGAGDARREQKGDALFLKWVSPDDNRRQLILATSGSLAVVGNDEAAVQACLAVRRGERPSLAGDSQLSVMRARVHGDGALAFGYVPAGGAARIAEALSPLLSTQISEDARVQGLLARMLPKLANNIVGAGGWSTRLEDGVFLDEYFLKIPAPVATRLSATAINADAGAVEQTAGLLPAGTHEATFYHFEEPEAAWVALNAGLSTGVDAIQAPFVTLALEALLKPYGVSAPREFLRASQAEVATARLQADSDTKVLIVNLRDRQKLSEVVKASLGDGVQTSNVGGVEFFVRQDEDEKRAAAFLNGFYILGTEENVRACLDAAARSETLNASEPFKAARMASRRGGSQIMTVTSDAEASVSFFAAFSRQAKSNAFDVGTLKTAVKSLPFSISETTVTDEGVGKHTRSPFGFLGTLAVRFYPRREGVEQVSVGLR